MYAPNFSRSTAKHMAIHDPQLSESHPARIKFSPPKRNLRNLISN